MSDAIEKLVWARPTSWSHEAVGQNGFVYYIECLAGTNHHLFLNGSGRGRLMSKGNLAPLKAAAQTHFENRLKECIA